MDHKHLLHPILITTLNKWIHNLCGPQWPSGRARSESTLTTRCSSPASQSWAPTPKFFVTSQYGSSTFVHINKQFALPARISFMSCTYWGNEWDLLTPEGQGPSSYITSMLLEWSQLRAEPMTHGQHWGKACWLVQGMHKVCGGWIPSCGKSLAPSRKEVRWRSSIR